MSVNVAIWVAWAIVLFWAIGAYNRLVRLRSQAISAFAALDDQLRHYVALVKVSFPIAADDQASVRAGLVGAAQQFDSSLRAARTHPLDAMAMRALETAYETLNASWLRLRNEPADLAGPPLPDTLQQQWEHISMAADIAHADFSRQVQAYNQGIVEFPARLLAWLFGFKSAHIIENGLHEYE